MSLISFAVTAKLICVFVFAYAKRLFSHDAAQMIYALILCIGVAMCDLVHDTETIFHLHWLLTAAGNFL